MWERFPEILRTGRLPSGTGADARRRDSAENRAFIQTLYDLCWLVAQSVAGAIDLAQMPREAFTLELARLGRRSEMVERD